MTSLEAIKFIEEHMNDVVNAVREAYRDSLQGIYRFDEKVLIYNDAIVHWSHQHNMWSQAEQDGEAICIYRVRGASDSDIDDETADCMLDNFDDEEEIKNIIMNLQYDTIEE